MTKITLEKWVFFSVQGSFKVIIMHFKVINNF